MLILPVGVRQSSRKGRSERLDAGLTPKLLNLILTSPPKTPPHQPEIPLTEESLSLGVTAKTKYLGAGRGLTFTWRCEWHASDPSLKGQRAEVMRVIRA